MLKSALLWWRWFEGGGGRRPCVITLESPPNLSSTLPLRLHFQNIFIYFDISWQYMLVYLYIFCQYFWYILYCTVSLNWNISSYLAWRLYFKHFIHIRRIWTANIFLKNIDNRLKEFWILWVSSFISLALAGEHSWFSSEEEIKGDDDVFGNRLEPNKWLLNSMRARLKCSILTQGSTQPRNKPPLQNVFVWILKCICLNFKMYLSEFQNVFVWILKGICLNFKTYLSEFFNLFV